MTSSPDLPFVGEERRAHLDRLVEAYEEVARTGESRLVVLTAPTGWGKTRVVRELYAHLAASDGGDYWPPRLEADGGSWLEARKCVFPAPFDVSEGASIPFLWLGVACQRDRMGRELAALQYAEAQFAAHVGPLAAALQGAGERWKTRLSAVGAVAGLFGLPDPVQAAMTWHGIATAGWEMLTGEWKTVRDRRAVDQARRVETHGAAEESGRGVVLAEQIARISGPDLPIVLVLDDAHWADAGTIAFTGALLGRRAHVLLVATAWPDRLAVQRSEPGTFAHALPGWIEAGRAERRELERLPDAVVARMVGDAGEWERPAPARGPAEPRLLRALCERADGNPNRLGGLMSLRVVRRALDSGASLTDEQIARLPTGDDEIVGAIWRELPEHVREVLAVSTVQGAEFNPEWIPAAAEILDLADVERGLTEARSPWGWLRAVDRALFAFLEAAFHERAEAEARTCFLPDELATARTAMLEWAAEQTRRPDWDTLPEAARRAMLEAHHAGVAEGLLAADAAALDSTLRLLELLELGEEVGRWRAVAERALAWTEGRPEHVEARWILRRKVADAVGEEGDVTGALVRYRSLIREHMRSFDETDEAHLELRYGFTWWLIVGGELAEAQAELGALLRLWTERHGPDDVKTLRARNRRAIALLEARRWGEALAEFEDVLDRMSAIRPPDDADVLRIRCWRANALGYAWKRAEAIAELQELVEAESRRVGPDHPATQHVRNDLGHWLLWKGRLEEAREVLEALLADRVRLLGPDHPTTLTTRGNLISVRAASGDRDGAVDQYETLLEDQIRVLGADDLRTLATVSNIATTLQEAERPDEARPWMERLLADRERVLGGRHPDTLLARLDAAVLLDEVGRSDRALDLLERLAEELPEVKGWAHRWTLRALPLLARLRREAGRADEGRRVLDDLVDRCAEASGPVGYETLQARRSRAAWLLDTARATCDPDALREAMDVLERLLADHDPSGASWRGVAEVERLLADARVALEG